MFTHFCNMRFKISLLYLSSAIILHVRGHGMLLDPPNRSSLWRFDETAPINYDDSENFCGGFGVQWLENQGKCGVCGDNYKLPHPQPNENTGTYGQGKIVANYSSGQVIFTSTLLTANHLGFFEFSLCEILDSSKVEDGEECFLQLHFADGSLRYPIKSGRYEVINEVKLPDSFKCDHCTLRWTYTTGNNWGICDDGTGAMGCGPQETFRSCSDIQIQ